MQIARNTQGLLLDAKQFAFEQEIVKKISSGWEYHSTTFVQVDLHSFNELYRCSRQISTFFSQKSRLCVRSDTSAFSVLVIVSPYFQITIVPRNFFKKKVLWMSLQEQKNRKRKVKSKQKPPLQLQIWLAEIFPPTFLLA